MRRRRLFPAVFVVLAVAGGFAAVIGGTAHALCRALALRASWPPELDTLAIPRAGLLRVLSLGHPEMASDLIAARANVYYGSQAAARGESRMLAVALETAMDLDPRFHRLYARGAAMLVYTGQAFNVEALTDRKNVV